MTDILCEKLLANGFPVDSFSYDERHFGNTIIESHLECGIKISIVKDRGIWDCSVIFGREEIPLTAVVYLLAGISFEFEELGFNSDAILIEWLEIHKNTLRILSNKDIREARKRWKVLNKERLKNMME